MTTLKYIPIAADHANKFRSREPDDNNLSPEKTFGGSCRYCLSDIEENEASLLLAYRPFSKINPYAECGPIFVHSNNCDVFVSNSTPEIITRREQVLIRGYDGNERIVEGTGKVIDVGDFESMAKQTLMLEDVDFLHVRSASNNCYFCRVELEA